MRGARASYNCLIAASLMVIPVDISFSHERLYCTNIQERGTQSRAILGSKCVLFSGFPRTVV